MFALHAFDFLLGTDSLSFKLAIAIGVSLGTVVLLLMSLLAAFVCFCVHTQSFRKKPQSKVVNSNSHAWLTIHIFKQLTDECPANNRAMIHNPLYDGNGPMYESILGDMVQCRQNSIQAVSTDTDHNRETVQCGRYVGEPTQLLLSQNQQRKPVLQPNTYDHLLDHKGMSTLMR